MAREYDNPFDTRRFFNIASPQPVNPLPRAYRGVTFAPTMIGRQDFEQPKTDEGRMLEDPLISAMSRVGGKALDAYRNHLDVMPRPEDYAPSRWRRLGAALTAGAASFGRDPKNALALGEEVRDAPYKGALESWQLKGAGLKEQAGLEQADQTAQIARLKQIYDMQDKRADNERLDRAQRATETYQQERINIMRQQGWKDTFGPNGELILYNPTTHESINTGMPTSKTTELGNANRALGQGDERVRQGWANVNLGQQNVGLRGQEVGISGYNATTGRMNAETAQRESQGRILGMGNNQVSPSEQFAAEGLAIRNALKINPDWSNWVNNDGTIKRPDQFWMHDPRNDPNYKTFLETVENEKRKIMGTRPPGSYNNP